MAYIWDIPGWNSGAKVRRSCWGRGDHIYRRDDGTWVYYVHTSSDGIARVAKTVMEANDWELYIETPTEVEVFEWMYPVSLGGWIITDKLMTEAEAAMYLGQSAGFREYRKTGRSFKVPVTKKGNENV